MYEDDFSNLGRKIQDTVQDAVESMNYDRLNQTINQTVNVALDEARAYKEMMRKKQEEERRKAQERMQQAAMQQKQAAMRQQMNQQRQHANVYQPNYQRPMQQKQIENMKKQQLQVVLAPKVKKGTGKIVGGVILAAMTGSQFGSLLFANAFGLSLGMNMAFIAQEILLLLCFLAGVAVALVGSSERRLYASAKRLVEILNGRGFCAIKELADKMNQSEKTTLKLVKKMIQKHLFREAYLDRQETCLMVNRVSYNYYLQAEQSKKEREQAEEQQRKEAEQIAPEIREMIRVGDEYIRTIREANDDIPGEVISYKLDVLENVVRKIFESVKKHPEQRKEMGKFMDYYMPTTLKLVNAYREFDAMEVKGENITKAMQEIEGTLDTINTAFEKLLDDLFQDTAFDLSTDMSVLQMMLAKEGYKEKDFQ